MNPSWVRHGCAACTAGKALVPHQRRARRRDKAFRTYCHRKGRRLFEVWEHDIKAGSDAVLVAATRR